MTSAMTSCGLLVRLHAKQGMEAAAEEFLVSTLALVQTEPDTTAWFAVGFGHGEYGIFDVFPNDAAREAHLAGPVALALHRRASELFGGAPRIEKFDVLADKLPVVSAFPDTKGLLLTFKPKAGREREVEDFFNYAHELVNNEHNTTAWFAWRTDEGEYGIFDVFPGSEGRLLHLMGHVPRELVKQAFTLLGSMPQLRMVTVQAEKIGPDVHQSARR